MTSPAISVLMAVRNEAQYLPPALDSLQRQTLDNWELIVVDDGSTDATPDILASFAARDQRVRIFRQEAKGLVPALNLGWDHCRSDLIARMDGDDICHPRRFEKQLIYMTRHPRIDLVATNIRHFPSHQVKGGMRHYENWQNSLLDHQTIMRDLFIESPFTQPSVMLRKRAVEQVGGYRDMGWGEDYDLWLRLALAGHQFARIPETLFFWREHPTRLTHQAEEFSLNSFRCCKVHHLKQSYLKNCSGVTLWGVGLEGKAWRKALLAQGIKVVNWIDVDPGKIGQTIHNASVATPETLIPGCGPMLITIGVRGARQMVRDKCHELGLTETIDYVCVT